MVDFDLNNRVGIGEKQEIYPEENAKSVWEIWIRRGIKFPSRPKYDIDRIVDIEMMTAPQPLKQYRHRYFVLLNSMGIYGAGCR